MSTAGGTSAPVRRVAGCGESATLTGRTLTEADVDAVANRVVKLLAAAAPGPTAIYLDTPGVAALYDVSEHWVRSHAAELGAIRVGHPRNGPLRFRADRVTAAMEARQVSAPPPGVDPRRPGQARGGADVELLPMPARRVAA
jgi:hypothetical protein